MDKIGKVADMTKIVEEYETAYFYELLIMIDHPDIDPAVITETLGLKPEGGWRVGEPRRTSSGNLLPGVGRSTYWYSSERIEEDRHFFEGINDLVDRVFVPHAEFTRKLVAEGGKIDVIAQLPGSINIGSALETETMTKLAGLGIQIGVEVFPHMT